MSGININIEDSTLLKQIESDYHYSDDFLRLTTKATYLNGEPIQIGYSNGIMYEDENPVRHFVYEDKWDNKLVHKIAKKYGCLVDGYEVYCLHGNLIKLVQCITAIDIAFGVVKK